MLGYPAISLFLENPQLLRIPAWFQRILSKSWGFYFNGHHTAWPFLPRYSFSTMVFRFVVLEFLPIQSLHEAFPWKELRKSSWFRWKNAPECGKWVPVRHRVGTDWSPLFYGTNPKVWICFEIQTSTKSKLSVKNSKKYALFIEKSLDFISYDLAF